MFAVSQAVQVLSKMDIPPMDYSNLDGFKNMVDERNQAMLEALGAPPADIKQTDHQVKIYDGSTVRARVYQPVPPPKEGSPLIVMYHGGGCVLSHHKKLGIACANP